MISSGMISTPPRERAPRHPAHGHGLSAGFVASGRVVHGDLGVIDLPTLLQMLAQRGMRGTLTVCHRGLTRMLNVDRESVSLAAPFRRGAYAPQLHRPRLGQILMLHGMVQRRDLEEAMNRQKRQPVRGRLGDLLLAQHAVTPDDLTRALALQGSEELQELMNWHDGTFDFRPGRASLMGQALPVPIFPLVMEAARRTDEWSRIRAALPSEERVAVRTGAADLSSGGVDRLTEAVLSLADGRHTTAEIVAQAGFPEFDVSGVLSRMVEQGRLILDRPHRDPPGAAPFDDTTRTLVVSPRYAYAAMLAAQLRDRKVAAEAVPPEDGALDRLLTESPPRIIVLDSHDPGADVRRLRRHPRAAEAKLLVLIAAPSRRDILSLLKQGADDVVVMPAPIERLVLRVYRLVLKISA